MDRSMYQEFFQPHPALKDFVNNIMIHEVRFQLSAPRYTFSFPPLPECGLFFYLRDRMDTTFLSSQKKETHPACIIATPQTKGVQITLGRHHLVVKVGFQPGGLYRFLSIPIGEFLSAGNGDAEIYLGYEIRLVTEQLQSAASYAEMKTIVENYLFRYVRKLKIKLPIDRVLPMVIKEGGLLEIDRLASEACLSIRQFERVFQQRIGLPPKLFSRLVRFANAWTLKENQPDISWIEIAHRCGYYDQMHLIRDFKEFAGVNPSSIEAEFRKWSVKFWS
ncbi:MAG TPA: helix-turn-helix domain-containing protein [Chryseolinea sp.]|nr:helix-turn-helix domain-containing protein [Chryseolinea sp.]